jgi:hypothetical protein
VAEIINADGTDGGDEVIVPTRLSGLLRRTERRNEGRPVRLWLRLWGQWYVGKISSSTRAAAMPRQTLGDLPPVESAAKDDKERNRSHIDDFLAIVFETHY